MAAIHRNRRSGAGIEKHFDRQGRLLDAGRRVGRATPAAVGVLRGEKPAHATLCGLAIHHTKVAVSGQHPGGAIGGVFIVGGVLVAEPQGEPGTVGTLVPGEVNAPLIVFHK